MKEGTGRAIFTEHDLLSKNSVYYFLFLGRLSKSAIGTRALTDSQIFIRFANFQSKKKNQIFLSKSFR